MKRNGFTLIELMIVVAIIGILSMMAMPFYKQYVARTRMAEILQLMAPYKLEALEMYIDKGQCRNNSATYNDVSEYVQNVTINGQGKGGGKVSKVTVGNERYDTVCSLAITFSNKGKELFGGRASVFYLNMADTGGGFVWACASRLTVDPTHALPMCNVEAMW